jgi:hypothetical protein
MLRLGKTQFWGTLISLSLAGLLSSCTVTRIFAPSDLSSSGAIGSESGNGPSSRNGEAACVPTPSNADAPPGEPPSNDYLGNGQIWTVLWPDGDIVFTPDGPGEIRADGSLAMKFPFWRGEGVRGEMVITGRSLHRPGLSMRAEIPDGYGDEGFQATALVFPEPGCWKVTARAGDAALIFVTKVTLRE